MKKDHRYYFSYFDLPKNGSPNYEEHWYYFDHGNVRFISLDTNTRYRKKIQLDWLKETLATIPLHEIDFVLAFFHHPHKSEAWNAGETEFSGKIQKILENYSLKTDIPSFHLCGHTHAYSRGHSFHSRHTMLSVASLGGDLDNWGEYKQRDYPEYIKTLVEYGWMHVQVIKEPNPKMVFKRYGYGNSSKLRDEGIRDQFSIAKYTSKPAKPKINAITRKKNDSTYNFDIKSSPYEHPNDSHLSTHILISKQENFQKIVLEKYYNKENFYFGKNKNKKINLSQIIINLNKNKRKKFDRLYFKIRYRNQNLKWSEWSEPYFFKTEKKKKFTLLLKKTIKKLLIYKFLG